MPKLYRLPLELYINYIFPLLKPIEIYYYLIVIEETELLNSEIVNSIFENYYKELIQHYSVKRLSHNYCIYVPNTVWLSLDLKYLGKIIDKNRYIYTTNVVIPTSVVTLTPTSTPSKKSDFYYYKDDFFMNIIFGSCTIIICKTGSFLVRESAIAESTIVDTPLITDPDIADCVNFIKEIFRIVNLENMYCILGGKLFHTHSKQNALYIDPVTDISTQGLILSEYILREK